MQQLITQCPQCQTRYEISHKQLKAANGQARCGSCEQVFDATQHIEAGARVNIQSDGEAIAREPLLLYHQPSGSNWQILLWWLLIVTAITGLAAQLLWFERDRLALEPDLRPLYSQLCQQVDCQLSPRQDLPSIQSQQLLIRKHPEFINALSLNLTLINEAPFDQPFPGLKLSFTGLDESLRASRTFQPDEYLAGDLMPGDLMPSHSPVQIELELLDPGTLAPNYQLQFVPAKAPTD